MSITPLRSLVGLHATLLFASIGLCQDPTGTLEGQISDSSGGMVPNAEVTITNSSTGFTGTQRSSSIGSFHFSYLPVGSYSLHVSIKGFASVDTSNIPVDVNRVVNLPVSLTIAGANEVTEVNTSAATVDVSSTLGNVVSAHDAVDLPLNGRNLTQLGLLQP